MNQTSNNSSVSQFVTFLLENDLFGIDVKQTKEVMNIVEITKVPNTLPYMRGVIDLRGIFVPVVDMRIKYGYIEKKYDESTVILIVEIDNKFIGLIVDTVLDVCQLETESIQNTSHFPVNIEKDSVGGIGKIGNKLVIILNTIKIFSKEEIEGIHGKKEEDQTQP